MYHVISNIQFRNGEYEMTVVRLPNSRIWNKKAKIQFCMENVKALNDYKYVKCENLEDYQIDEWVRFFESLWKNKQL